MTIFTHHQQKDGEFIPEADTIYVELLRHLERLTDISTGQLLPKNDLRHWVNLIWLLTSSRTSSTLKANTMAIHTKFCQRQSWLITAIHVYTQTLDISQISSSSLQKVLMSLYQKML